MKLGRKVKVLVVDDSVVIRSILVKAISSDPMINVIGEAADPYEARALIGQEIPDVLTLDIEMPKMDGLTFLQKMMASLPIPSIIVSKFTAKDSNKSDLARQYGAYEVIHKPDLNCQKVYQTFKRRLIYTIHAAAKNIVDQDFNSDNLQQNRKPRPRLGIRRQEKKTSTLKFCGRQMIVIGSSTGGTHALEALFDDFPDEIPPVLVVQHMPPGFTQRFAHRLNQRYVFRVKEAEDGENISANHVYLAPGDFHMEVIAGKQGFQIQLNQEPKVNSCRPSADVLMHSAATHLGKRAIGIILTGMGQDGADGILAMKKQRAKTIAQDESTSTVYGMPKAAMDLGAVDISAPLHEIAENIAKFMKDRQS